MVGIPPSLSPYISVLHRKIVNNKVEMVFYSSLFDITTVEILSFFFFFFSFARRKRESVSKTQAHLESVWIWMCFLLFLGYVCCPIGNLSSPLGLWPRVAPRSAPGASATMRFVDIFLDGVSKNPQNKIKETNKKNQ